MLSARLYLAADVVKALSCVVLSEYMAGAWRETFTKHVGPCNFIQQCCVTGDTCMHVV